MLLLLPPPPFRLKMKTIKRRILLSTMQSSWHLLPSECSLFFASPILAQTSWIHLLFKNKSKKDGMLAGILVVIGPSLGIANALLFVYRTHGSWRIGEHKNSTVESIIRSVERLKVFWLHAPARPGKSRLLLVAMVVFTLDSSYQHLILLLLDEKCQFRKFETCSFLLLLDIIV